MSEALDRMRREVEELKRILRAQKAGIPATVSVLCYSDDPKDIEAAHNAVLARYGLSSADEVRQAGSSFEVVSLPYCLGRGVDTTHLDSSRLTSDIFKGMEKSGAPSEPVRGSYQDLYLRGVLGSTSTLTQGGNCTDNAPLLDTPLNTESPAP